MIIAPIMSFFAVLGFVRLVRHALGDPMVRGLVVAMAVAVTAGTLVYHYVEGWSFVNAFYFSVVTLTTIGYGDYVPTTAGAKLFTCFYCFLGVGLFAAGATTIMQRSRLWMRLEEEAGVKAEREANTPAAGSGE